MLIQFMLAGADPKIFSDFALENTGNPMIIAFLADDDMLEISFRRIGAGFVLETYRKIDGETANIAKKMQASTEATERLLRSMR